MPNIWEKKVDKKPKLFSEKIFFVQNYFTHVKKELLDKLFRIIFLNFQKSIIETEAYKNICIFAIYIPNYLTLLGTLGNQQLSDSKLNKLSCLCKNLRDCKVVSLGG